MLRIDGARSKLNLGEEERASRRAAFANATHLVLDAGHAVQRHRAAEVAAAIVAHAS